MSLFLYSPKNQPGLDALILALGATRLFRFDGEAFWDKNRKGRIAPPEGSKIVGWGTLLPELEGYKVLNARAHTLNEVEIFDTLYNSGVKTSRAHLESQNSKKAWDDAPDYVPMKFGKAWTPTTEPNPDFYYNGTSSVNSYVVHSFDGKSIRAGKKTLLPGRSEVNSVAAWKTNPTILSHPFIKTPEAGWGTDHTISSTPALRALAHKVAKVLEVDFVEIHINEATNGGLSVGWVNLAPTINHPNSLKVYVKSILKWAAQEEVPSATV